MINTFKLMQLYQLDATVAAAGGYHMTAVANANSKHEHGVGVLDAAYYSSQGLSVSEELNKKTIQLPTIYYRL